MKFSALISKISLMFLAHYKVIENLSDLISLGSLCFWSFLAHILNVGPHFVALPSTFHQCDHFAGVNSPAESGRAGSHHRRPPSLHSETGWGSQIRHWGKVLKTGNWLGDDDNDGDDDDGGSVGVSWIDYSPVSMVLCALIERWLIWGMGVFVVLKTGNRLGAVMKVIARKRNCSFILSMVPCDQLKQEESVNERFDQV